MCSVRIICLSLFFVVSAWGQCTHLLFSNTQNLGDCHFEISSDQLNAKNAQQNIFHIFVRSPDELQIVEAALEKNSAILGSLFLINIETPFEKLQSLSKMGFANVIQFNSEDQDLEGVEAEFYSGENVPTIIEGLNSLEAPRVVVDFIGNQQFDFNSDKTVFEAAQQSKAKFWFPNNFQVSKASIAYQTGSAQILQGVVYLKDFQIFRGFYVDQFSVSKREIIGLQLRADYGKGFESKYMRDISKAQPFYIDLITYTKMWTNIGTKNQESPFQAYFKGFGTAVPFNYTVFRSPQDEDFHVAFVGARVFIVSGISVQTQFANFYLESFSRYQFNGLDPKAPDFFQSTNLGARWNWGDLSVGNDIGPLAGNTWRIKFGYLFNSKKQ